MKEYLIDCRTQEADLPDLLCLSEYQMPRLNAILDKPVEDVYDWCLYILKHSLDLRILVACKSLDGTEVWIPYDIASVSDIKDVWERLAHLNDGGSRYE